MANLSYNNCVFDTSIDQPWFPASFPPLAIYYGDIDYLVLGKPLVDRITRSEPNVRLLKASELVNYEHIGQSFRSIFAWYLVHEDSRDMKMVNRYALGCQCRQGLLLQYSRCD